MLTLALALPGSAWALSAAFDVPEQSALTGIPEFARQAGLQIIAPADPLKRVRTPRIKGAMDVHVALARLIANTGLEVAGAQGGVITLRAVAPRAPPPRPPMDSALPVSSAVRQVSATEVDPLVVLGGGQARQVQYVRGADMSIMTPGSSPLRLIAKLPSVNFETSDAFGANEWSVRVSVRNFVQGRLGFTLDDVPLGDMTYGNHNGLHISRAISGENLASVELSQGVGSLEAASSSNLGGTLKFLSRDPSLEPGVSLVAAAGSDSTYRGVLRLESGELATGTRGYATYAYNTTNKWQGVGRQYSQQVNLKAVQPVASGSLTGFINLSRRRESDPQDLSLNMVHRLGLGWDNLSGNWALAVRIAEIAANRGEANGGTDVTPHNPEVGTVYPGAITSADDAYYDSTTARDDVLTGLTLRMPLGNRVDLKSTVYEHWDKGQGLWWTPYVASPNYGVAGATTDNAPISIRSTEYDIRRRGVLASATGHFGDHVTSAGLWLEDNDFVQTRRFYGLNLAGPQRSYTDFQTGAFRTDWAYHFITRTQQFYIQDLWTVNDDLTLTAGFKSLSVSNQAITRTGPNLDGRIVAADHFLPRVGVRYQPGSSDEFFANYGRGMRAFSASNTSGPFATTQAAFDAIKPNLRPEISDSFELGWRHSSADVTLLTAVYDTRFRNRLFSTPVGQGILGNPSILANVGSVTAYGLETAVSWRFAPDWTAFASYAFNHAVYDDDVFDGDGVRIGKTKGKLAVDAPVHLAKVHLDYAHEGFFAHLGVSYLSKRYFSYENDQSVPSQLLTELAAGYRFSGSGLRDGLEAQVNVSNLFDVRYISTIGSNDYPIRGDAQTLLAGPPRQMFVTLRKAF
ncbi:TonB-dependent receptor [Phenylobacterium sp.]|uniref:TonB-dependent receptor n=1 Tax=Phenylobacterium sp. TaxID=1871053 RepID=UPI003561F070